MKTLFLYLIVFFQTLSAYSCKCRAVSFTEEYNWSDEVFIGTVINKYSSEQVYGISYTFTVSEIFKGQKIQTITVATGFGGPDCGMEFEIGKTYLVYSKNKATGRCGRNSLIEESRDLGKLKFLFDNSFKEEVGKSSSAVMTDNEAFYFNHELSNRRGDFDFKNKKIAFYSNTKLISKQEYFNQWGGKDVSVKLIGLTEIEKQQKQGYDAMLVLDDKRKMTNSLRKKLLKLLK
jgi:hypothetical protein